MSKAEIVQVYQEGQKQKESILNDLTEKLSRRTYVKNRNDLTASIESIVESEASSDSQGDKMYPRTDPTP